MSDSIPDFLLTMLAGALLLTAIGVFPLAAWESNMKTEAQCEHMLAWYGPKGGVQAMTRSDQQYWRKNCDE